MRFQTAVVTGGSRGLGRALCDALAAGGTKVAVVARDRARTEAVAREIGGVAVVADVGDPASARRIGAEVWAALGDVDLVVHNASELGPVPLRPLLDVSPEEMARVFEVNVLGPFRLTRAFAGAMALRGHGTLLAISSDAAVAAYPRWGPYGASKAAFDHVVRVLAAELDGTGVRVLSVDPGEMDTDMHRDAIPEADPATLLRPEVVAERILARIGDQPSGTRFSVAT